MSFSSQRPGEPTPPISDAHRGPTGVLEVIEGRRGALLLGRCLTQALSRLLAPPRAANSFWPGAELTERAGGRAIRLQHAAAAAAAAAAAPSCCFILAPKTPLSACPPCLLLPGAGAPALPDGPRPRQR